jgi:hypothetical protein
MKNKIVLWANNQQDEKVLVAMELLVRDNMVKTWIIPESLVTDAFERSLMEEWQNDQPVEFPDQCPPQERPLQIAESLLPEDIMVERDSLLRRAQTEWHFAVLSNKLFDAYLAEVDDLKERVEQLDQYDAELWEALKSIWSKVQSQDRERNLERQQVIQLRERVDELFTKMKALRSQKDREYTLKSAAARDALLAEIASVEARIAQGRRFSTLFDELRKLQSRYRETQFQREHRDEVWNRLDACFKTLKEKRFGADVAKEGESQMERVKRRYEGLLEAIKRLEYSVSKEQEELDLQHRKIDRTDAILEAEILKAKIMMIEQRKRSKEIKLNEMLGIKANLEQRMQSLQAKEAEIQQRRKLREAKRAAEAKIAEQMKESANLDSEMAEKLARAAESINQEKANLRNTREKVAKMAPKAPAAASRSFPAADIIADVLAVAEAVDAFHAGGQERRSLSAAGVENEQAGESGLVEPAE